MARSGPPLPITPENPFGLTELDRMIIAEFSKDFDAIRVAEHLKAREHTIYNAMRRPEVRAAFIAYLQQRQRIVERALGGIRLESERVLLEIARIAMCDARKLFDERGALRALDDIDDNTAAAIAGIETEERYELQKVPNEETGQMEEKRVLVGYGRKIKLWNKNQALDQAMKHLGGYEADNRQKNPMEEAATLKLSAARAKLAAIISKAEKKVDNTPPAMST